MYYVLEHDKKYPITSSFYDETPGHHMKWYTGQLFQPIEYPSNLELHLDDEDSYPTEIYPDYFTGIATSFCSRNMRELLNEGGANNIQYFSVSLFDEAGRSVEKEYFAMNIVGRIECMNFEKSKCKSLPGGQISRIISLALDESKIHDIPIFRLDELPEIILLKDVLRDSLLNLPGVQLSPADGWNDSHLF